MAELLIHCLLISYVLMRLIAGDFVPQWRELWRSAVFCRLLYRFVQSSIKFGIKIFLPKDTSSGSPLEPIYDVFGSYYILGLIFIVLMFWLVIYLPWSWKNHQKFG